MNRIRTSAFTFGLVALCASSIHAQSIYIDFGSNSPPSSSYAAAAGTPGVWNEMPMPITSQPLVDIAGQATGARFSSLECDGWAENFPSTSGDDGALLDDWFYADCSLQVPRIEITGLAAGVYHVYAYPKAEQNVMTFYFATTNSSGFQSVVQLPAAPTFPGSFGGWLVTELDVVIQSGEALTLRFLGSSNTGTSGVQLVRVGDASPQSTSFCFGDGSGATCPCSNAGVSGHGCGNPVTDRGALLVASGTASVSSDSLTLSASAMSGFQSWYFQGTAQASTPFGHGIQCLSGSVVRVGQKSNSGSSSSNPSGVDLPLSVKGAIPPSGGTRHYQVAYRQATPACAPLPFSNTNRTNGMTVVWVP